jgi:hypothetical protein
MATAVAVARATAHGHTGVPLAVSAQPTLAQCPCGGSAAALWACNWQLRTSACLLWLSNIRLRLSSPSLTAESRVGSGRHSVLCRQRDSECWIRVSPWLSPSRNRVGRQESCMLVAGMVEDRFGGYVRPGMAKSAWARRVLPPIHLSLISAV